MKKVFLTKKKKSGHHHGIVHIWISLSTKFQLKLTIWVFGPNLPRKGTTEKNKQPNKLQAFGREIAYLFSPGLVLTQSSSGMGGAGGAKNPPTSFSHLTSTNVRIIPLYNFPNSQLLCYSCVKF